ncbi:hypothetical protein Tco_0342521, partial [Tanacetum coccineum]
ARITDVPVYTAAATVTSARENVDTTPTSDVAGSSQLETSEGSDDSFYELPALNSAEATLPMTRYWMMVFPAAHWLTALPHGFFSTLHSMDYE